MNRILLDRRYWLVPLALWTAVVLASFAWNLSAIRYQVDELSASQGREVFRIMEALRLWNARHGGVFALQTEDTPPNPYLDSPDREVRLDDGRRLSLVNPAYMTRQLAATFFELTATRVHITSLNPINPGNHADPWEAAALKAFEGGERERAEVVDAEGIRVARYMAPLVTREACLECHRKQGYQVGDIRGGISVTFPTAAIDASVGGQVRTAALVHLVGWALVAALTLFALARSRQQLVDLARAKEVQEALVEERTGELRREVAERHQAETRLRLLVEASGNGIFGLAAGGECTFINPVALKLLGAPGGEAFLGRPLLDLIVPPGDQAQALHQALARGQSLHSEDCCFHRGDGTTFHVEIRLDPIGDGGGAVANFSDITERKATQASIWHQANYDALTGLANRSHLHRRLGQILADARHSGEIIALLFVDLDGFKAVNDTWGHEAGDCVLKEAASRLAAGIRESDLAARLAGDEFLVVLRHLGRDDDAGSVAAKLIAALAAPCHCGGNPLQVSASIGIALYPGDAGDPDTLVKCADQAMYRAKEAGKHTWRLYADQG